MSTDENMVLEWLKKRFQTQHNIPDTSGGKYSAEPEFQKAPTELKPHFLNHDFEIPVASGTLNVIARKYSPDSQLVSYLVYYFIKPTAAA